jgi:hypothetical protein
MFEDKQYEQTKVKNWTMNTNGRPGRGIDPILALNNAYKMYKALVKHHMPEGYI